MLLSRLLDNWLSLLGTLQLNINISPNQVVSGVNIRSPHRPNIQQGVTPSRGNTNMVNLSDRVTIRRPPRCFVNIFVVKQSPSDCQLMHSAEIKHSLAVVIRFCMI